MNSRILANVIFLFGMLAVLVAVLATLAITQHANGHEHGVPFAEWFQSLKQPDHPASCCGPADQYYADRYEPSKVTTGYRALVSGVWIEVPPNKIIRGQRNPTGRGVLFMSFPRDNGSVTSEPFVYCFVPADEA